MYFGVFACLAMSDFLATYLSLPSAAKGRPNARKSAAACSSVSAVVVIAMYPLCRWFAALKQRRTDMWLSYL